MELDFDCELAVQRVVDIINKYYSQTKEIETIDKKIGNDIVTDIDIFMEKSIIAELSKFYPTHSFNAEEQGEMIKDSNGDFYEWLIDPIDGTINFAAGMPEYGVVAALQKNGETILGVTVLPKINEVFTCIKGKGAFCNGKKISVSKNTELGDCLIGVYMYLNDTPEINKKTAKLLETLNPICRGVRIVGCSSMASCYVAYGKFDAIINLRATISLGSTTGRLCIEEAGGKVTNIKNEPRSKKDTMICSNSLIHDKLYNIISQIVDQ